MTVSEIARSMERLKKALEKRIAMADRADELKARAPRPIRSGALAAYDTAALGRKLRPMLEFDGRGWRVLAAEIGVTSPDLSRIMAGQDIAAGKVFAICDWAGLDARAFYRPAAGSPKPRKRPRKSFASPRASAAKPPRRSPAGRGTTGGVPLDARPSGAEAFHGKSTETADGYDAASDGHDSYFAAIEAKRKRGDRHDWEKPGRIDP